MKNITIPVTQSQAVAILDATKRPKDAHAIVEMVKTVMEPVTLAEGVTLSFFGGGFKLLVDDRSGDLTGALRLLAHAAGHVVVLKAVAVA